MDEELRLALDEIINSVVDLTAGIHAHTNNLTEHLRDIQENTSEIPSMQNTLDEINDNTARGNGLFSTIGDLLGNVNTWVYSLLGLTVVAAAKADKDRVKFATFLVDTNKIVSEVGQQTELLGTSREHLEKIIALREVGLKEDKKAVNNMLVLQDRMGRSSGMIVDLVSQQLAAGSSEETMQKVLDKIVDVTMNTRQTAEATIASLQGLKGFDAILETLNVGPQVKAGMIEAGKGLSETQQVALGKFVRDLIDPNEMPKLIALGLQPYANEILNASDPKQVEQAIRGAIEQAGGTTKDLVLGAQGEMSNILIKNLRERIIGQIGDAALSLKHVIDNAGPAAQHFKEGGSITMEAASTFNSAQEVWDKSFAAVGAQMKTISEQVGAAAHSGFTMSQSFGAVTDNLEKFRVWGAEMAPKLERIIEAIDFVLVKASNVFGIGLGESETERQRKQHDSKLLELEAKAKKRPRDFSDPNVYLPPNDPARSQLGILDRILKSSTETNALLEKQIGETSKVGESQVQGSNSLKKAIKQGKFHPGGVPGTFFDSTPVGFK